MKQLFLLLCGACLIVAVAGFGRISEQKRDTPQRRQSDDNIDDTADDPWLSAEEERDQIELKQANAAPVDTAYDQ